MDEDYGSFDFSGFDNTDISSLLGGDSGIDFGSLDAGPGGMDLSGLEGIDLSGLLNLNSPIDFGQIPGDFGGSLGDELAALLSDSGNASSLFSGDGGLNIEDLLKTEGGAEELSRSLGSIKPGLAPMGGGLTKWENSFLNPEVRSRDLQQRISAGSDFTFRDQNEGYRPNSPVMDDYGNTLESALASSGSKNASSLFSDGQGAELASSFDSTGIDAGEGAFDISSLLGDAAGLPEKADTRGYYDEITGKFVSDPLGGLTGELTNETSGTNADSMKGYKYDKATGTWKTPTGEVYKPDKAPSNTVKSGAQVMVDAGALPKGYAGLTATKGSTADIKGGKDGTTTTKVIDNLKKVIGGGTSTKTGDKKDNNMLMMMLALMAMMNKGGGGSSSPSAVIPSLSADRKQLPYGAASGARPGAGGVNYFSPTTYTQRAAGGGMMYGGGGISDLGGYSDGGRLLRGPGDGVSDSIPATIGGKQPARLAEGEFVVPARIVSELGNGSTNAGAQKLYAMMDRVQGARRKTKNVAANTKAHKYLPA